jgi:hypothetical protein
MHIHALLSVHVTHHTRSQHTQHHTTPQVVDAAATERKQAAEDAKAKEKGEEPAKVEAVMKTDYEDVWGWRVQNDNKPIWTRNPKVGV